MFAGGKRPDHSWRGNPFEAQDLHAMAAPVNDICHGANGLSKVLDRSAFVFGHPGFHSTISGKHDVLAEAAGRVVNE